MTTEILDLNVNELLLIPALPLIAALISGLFGWFLKEKLSHLICILGVVASAILSVHVFCQVVYFDMSFYGNFWTWIVSDTLNVPIGMMIDKLTVTMMVTVTVVSSCVHIYTVGYMHGDKGYSRFFAYISAFTFSMLVLVMGNSFFTLFFGWEAVGLFSYLLIGFWFTKESANVAAMKAFIVNRVGDFGFAIGILAVWYYFGSVDYATVFLAVKGFVAQDIHMYFANMEVSVITFICLALFVGAMGKSAQVPLHVWLPDSMEGPTPISALIHAATMVTAGVFMVARLSPLFEFSEVALATVVVVGAITAWMCATIGLVQNDIKRVIAYSTCSQLGYMFVACGVSAYSAGIFHLMTHAYFKALLFLAAGSVIHAMMHEQDIRKMGQLRKYMPITYFTCLIGAVALAGIPPFAGFWSKDLIIEAVQVRDMGWVTSFAEFALITGVFMTAFYTFRMFYLTFHNSDRVDPQVKKQLHESPASISLPLIILAIGATFAGLWGYYSLGMAGTGAEAFFGDAIFVTDAHNPLITLEAHAASHHWYHFLLTLPFWCAVGGIALATFMYLKKTKYPAKIAAMFPWLHQFLLDKWRWDELYQIIFVQPARCIGQFLWQKADLGIIDKGIIHKGVVDHILAGAAKMRAMQTGLLSHYAFAMVIGVFSLLTYLILKA
ncbi:MAG: NADH-quinone oxidoreductase subunit L [Mariprofundaceae bacterium]|nr:NADH-quinone oxidoreductase subunit L [Mariprofundaceae bacterium]